MMPLRGDKWLKAFKAVAWGIGFGFFVLTLLSPPNKKRRIFYFSVVYPVERLFVPLLLMVI
jgi:hypothetical protein